MIPAQQARQTWEERISRPNSQSKGLESGATFRLRLAVDTIAVKKGRDEMKNRENGKMGTH